MKTHSVDLFGPGGSRGRVGWLVAQFKVLPRVEDASGTTIRGKSKRIEVVPAKRALKRF